MFEPSLLFVVLCLLFHVKQASGRFPFQFRKRPFTRLAASFSIVGEMPFLAINRRIAWKVDERARRLTKPVHLRHIADLNTRHLSGYERISVDEGVGAASCAFWADAPWGIASAATDKAVST
jgi:hypothetical protein